MVRVLIAEEDRGLLDLAKAMLWQVHGMNVDQSTSAKEALLKAKAGGYDAVVADQVLPDLSGLELLELLRAGGTSTPFIMLVPKDGEGLTSRVSEGGAFCLRKNADLHLLVSELGNVINIAVQVRQTAASMERRRKELTRNLTLRLISRVLVDRISDNQNFVSQNRFRDLGGLPRARSMEGDQPEQEGLEAFLKSDLMSQLIDRLAERIDFMEIEGEARLVQEAIRRFHGPR